MDAIQLPQSTKNSLGDLVFWALAHGLDVDRGGAFIEADLSSGDLHLGKWRMELRRLERPGPSNDGDHQEQRTDADSAVRDELNPPIPPPPGER